MNYHFLSKTILFQGVRPDDMKVMLECLGAYTKKFQKNEIIYSAGSSVEALGIVLSGSVHITMDDLYGNSSIFGHISPGEIFAETYASIPGSTMLVNVIAAENTEVLFLNISKVMTICSNSCEHHNKLIKNMLLLSARKNLELSKRMTHTTSKSIRGRLLSYFSEQVTQNGTNTFTIPFNRQQLADYLNVERSALCNELSKMKQAGMIDYEKNHFMIL